MAILLVAFLVCVEAKVAVPVAGEREVEGAAALVGGASLAGRRERACGNAGIAVAEARAFVRQAIFQGGALFGVVAGRKIDARCAKGR